MISLKLPKLTILLILIIHLYLNFNLLYTIMEAFLQANSKDYLSGFIWPIV